MTSRNACRCCESGQGGGLPRVYPECGHFFREAGWVGIDAHWRSRHEEVARYEDFWSGLCDKHRFRH
jgi:hypothetical protein